MVEFIFYGYFGVASLVFFVFTSPNAAKRFELERGRKLRPGVVAAVALLWVLPVSIGLYRGLKRGSRHD